MSVDLSALPLRRMAPMPVRPGGRVASPLNGATTFIDRLGARWSFECQTPPMPLEPDGRRWAARLMEASRLGGRIRIAQPGFNTSAPGTPVVASATAAGRLVPLSGVQPGYAFREGQWVSIIIGGQRYADQIAEQAIASTSGTVTIRLQNLLRKPLAGGETVEVLAVVEGAIQLSDGWNVDNDEVVSFSFTITEDE